MTSPQSLPAAIFFDRARWAEEAAALDALSLPGTQIVGVDLNHPAPAFGVMIAARRRGIPVAIFAVYADPLDALVVEVGASIQNQAHDDQRAQLYEAFRDGRLKIAGKTPKEATESPASIYNAAGFTVRVADLVLVATPAEYGRLERLSGVRFPRWALLPLAQAQRLGPASESGITIYAPGRSLAEVAPVLATLEQRGWKPQCITKERASVPISGGIVVIPEFWRGMLACDLARAGYRVAVPTRCGAEARYSGIATFKPEHFGSIADTVDLLHSLGAPVAKQHIDAAPAAAIVQNDRPSRTEGPLVSIVVRAFDRPDFLARAIKSIAAQTYRSIEIVLVDNGGTELLGTAAGAAGETAIRHVRPPSPLKLGAALNAGMKAAKGEFVGYLDDDDILYPEHIARSVDILLRSGADVSYSNCVGDYARIDTSGKKTVLGMQVYTDWPYTLDQLHVSNVTTIHSVVHRRSLLERFGYTDESLPVTEDWELWLRFAVGGARFIHLDRPTCEYSWREDARSPNTSTERRGEFADAYETIIARYHMHVQHRATTILPRQKDNVTHLRARAEVIKNDPAAGLRLSMADVLFTAVPVEGLNE